jgi:hypothetical protein
MSGKGGGLNLEKNSKDIHTWIEVKIKGLLHNTRKKKQANGTSDYKMKWLADWG